MGEYWTHPSGDKQTRAQVLANVALFLLGATFLSTSLQTANCSWCCASMFLLPPSGHENLLM